MSDGQPTTRQQHIYGPHHLGFTGVPSFNHSQPLFSTTAWGSCSPTTQMRLLDSQLPANMGAGTCQTHKQYTQASGMHCLTLEVMLSLQGCKCAAG